MAELGAGGVTLTTLIRVAIISVDVTITLVVITLVVNCALVRQPGSLIVGSVQQHRRLLPVVVHSC